MSRPNRAPPLTISTGISGHLVAEVGGRDSTVTLVGSERIARFLLDHYPGIALAVERETMARRQVLRGARHNGRRHWLD